ncbi:RNA-directed RNA polymerase [ssRNA phage SRR5466728_3]|uniref:RNA-directed RNA polymerase n=1 Tax=ssRNA phage SRR5466728_3 TaxID=2786441 RepID=A0A8S5L468_9VIRU|nr:RNA-directed RNA polymerase [ssRNA phage SRR5466728_3]DAD52465.1 TPA_asm: RNA-directed RNA polymerase [ssRNA phage SRR5466728_3]
MSTKARQKRARAGTNCTERDIAVEAFRLFCKNVGSPFSDRALNLLDRKDYLGLASLDINPSDYDNAYSFHLDYTVHGYLRKYQGFITDSAKLEKEAKLNLEKVEAKNRETNEILRHWRHSRDVDRILLYAKRKIASILGPFKFSKVLPHCEWGSGATSSLNRRSASLDKKILERRLSVTQRCVRYARAYMEHDIHWMAARLGTEVLGPVSPLSGEFLIVEDGRFTTVPKTVKTLRPIEIQPTLNLFFQKGVGMYIRRQLQKNGINLDDQSRNQVLAALAFANGYSTIDLANASDTVTRELVRHLLPEEWYDYLNDIRTHSICVDGSSRKLERFSAMGNGFTFELESLIFYAIASAVRDDLGAYDAVVSVYGDDIIVSRNIAEKLVSYLDSLGFTVNKDKTFIDGSFYESCGKHYFNGVDVTPIYQKEAILQKIDGRVDNPALVRAANRFIRLANALGRGLFLDAKCQGSFSLFRSSIRLAKPVSGPIWVEGDGHIKDPYYRPKVDIHGTFYIREFRGVGAKRRLVDDAPLYATSLRRGVVVENPFNGFVDIAGVTRTLLSRRRCFLQLVDVPVWASSWRKGD